MTRANISVMSKENRNVLNPNSQSYEERIKDLEMQNKILEEALQRERNSTFRRWGQSNFETSEELMWLTLNHPKARVILDFLTKHMDMQNSIMCSYQVLQEVLGVSKDRVRINIKILKEYGYIAVLKSGASNVYAVNDNICWKSWGSNKKYSKFPTNVILSLSEQGKEYQNKLKNISTEKYQEINLRE
jgi:predicted transcriptional regulator